MPVTARNFRRYDRDNGQAGMIAPSTGGIYAAQGSIALTASRAYLARFVPSRTFSATVIAFVCSTAAGADDAVDVGLYDSAYGRLVSAGATTGKLTGTGLKTVTVAATTLQAGNVYYAAFSVGTFGGTAGQVLMTNLAASSAPVDFFGSGAGVRELTFMASAHPLPSTVTAAGTIGQVPILAVRES